MALTTGRFVWRELLTHDLPRAKAFYGEVFGWKTRDVPMGDSTYTLFDASGVEVAGAMAAPVREMPSHWLGYVHVSSVDDTLAAATAAGGKVVKPGTDIPDIGRFGIFFDDLGAATCAFSPTSEGKPPAPPKVGEFCWESINTPDVAKTIAFYTQVYGWKTSPFGPDMTTFGLGDGMQNQIASITPAPAGVRAHWLNYVVVDKLAPARDRVKRLGGAILVEEIAVPGVGAFAVAQDPQQAAICLFEGV